MYEVWWKGVCFGVFRDASRGVFYEIWCLGMRYSRDGVLGTALGMASDVPGFVGHRKHIGFY